MLINNKTIFFINNFHSEHYNFKTITQDEDPRNWTLVSALDACRKPKFQFRHLLYFSQFIFSFRLSILRLDMKEEECNRSGGLTLFKRCPG